MTATATTARSAILHEWPVAAHELLVGGAVDGVIRGRGRWSIRPISSGDLASIAAELPAAPYRTHSDDLEWQRTGAVTELVAWDGHRPVGSGLIHWTGPRDASIATRLPLCPEIFRLEVLETHRSRGIGAALVRQLEALARARGLRQVGLGVATANRRARKLYERLGYCPLPASDYVDRWECPDRDGRRRIVEDPCSFMVKGLRSAVPWMSIFPAA